MRRSPLAVLLLASGCALAQSGNPSQVAGSASPWSVHVTTADCNEANSLCGVCLEVRDAASNATLYKNFPSSICTGTDTLSKTILEATSYGLTFLDRHEGGVDGLEVVQTCREDVAGTCTPTTPATVAIDSAGMRGTHDDASTLRTRVRFHDLFSRPDHASSSDLLDDLDRNWECSSGGGATFLHIQGGIVDEADSNNTQAICDTTALPDLSPDQFVMARVRSAETSGTNVDFQLRVRVNGTNDVQYYGFKWEGGNVHFQKLYDVDGDGTLDIGEYAGACGLNAAANSPLNSTWIWLRVEVYTDPADASQVLLRGYTAPDSSGSPGTWTHEMTVQDGTTDTCTSWNFFGANLAAGATGFGYAKVGDHQLDEYVQGIVLHQGARNHPQRRSP